MSGGPGTAMGISVDLVSSDQQAPRGFIHTVPASKAGGIEQEWVYVQAEAATAINQGDVLVYDAVSPAVVPSAALTAFHPISVVGVAQNPIPAGYWGFVLKKGLGFAKIGAATVTNESLILSALTATDGEVRPGATTDAAIGVLLGGGTAGPYPEVYFPVQISL